MLNGSLTVPEGATLLVLFVHGRGSRRHSPRNQFVAQKLNAAGLATLLFHLLTREEEAVDVRVAELAADWLVHHTAGKGVRFNPPIHPNQLVKSEKRKSPCN